MVATNHAARNQPGQRVLQKKRIKMPGEKKILKIGVTGSAGSGKSQVCQAFEKIGLTVLSCDQIAREVVMPGEKGLEQLVERFGPQILALDSTLDRKSLRGMLLKDPGQKKIIEQILHPLIKERMKQQVRNAIYNGEKVAVVVEVPLLFESNMDDLFDVTIAVIGDEDQMIERIGRRDGVSVDNARGLISVQMSQEKKAMRADYVVQNKGSRAQLFDLVDKLFDKIQKDFLTI